MNCRDIDQLLDLRASRLLSRTRGEAIDLHLETCPACSVERAYWREFTALPVPPTPVALMDRIEAALPANEPVMRRSRRPFVIGGLLVAAAAAAAAVLLRPAGADSASSRAVAGPGVAAGDVGAIATPSQPAISVAVADGGSASGDGDAVALDPRTILVVKRPETTADGLAIAAADQCHDALVAQLRVLPGVNLVMGATAKDDVPAFQIAEADRVLGRRAGAGHVLAVTTENGCRIKLFDTATGASAAGGMNGQPLPVQDGWTSFASSMAQDIRRALHDPADAAGELHEYRATLLDATRSDLERAQALGNLARERQRRGAAGSSLVDKEVIAAAIQLGTKSAHAGVRGGAWVHMRGIRDPRLTAPLLQSLANDPDAEVRTHAAYALHFLLDEPGVRAALQRAAAEDTDSAPEVVCCIDTVREAAERASVPDGEFRDWVRGKLLDTSLPARSRLYNLGAGSSDGRFVLSLEAIGEDAAGEVFEIGRREADPRVRSMAWNILARALPDASFRPVLLGDLAGHQDEYVRSAAATALRGHAQDPDVRAALQRATEDPSMEVRRAAAAALAERATR